MNPFIKKANQYIKNHKHEVNQMYKHDFHFTPELGWLNDPNGFLYHNGIYHLFFQYHPYDSSWGPMHWGHAISKDLVSWTHLDVALAPLQLEHGEGAAFSGSAIICDDHMILIYTENYFDRQEQCIAYSTDFIHFERSEKNPIIKIKDLPKDASTTDFRDPKIWKDNDVYYMVVSSKSDQSAGQVLLYSSKNLTNWMYMNTILKSHKAIGDMWECPDLFSLNDKDILIVSPQYIKSDAHKFSNVHHSIYFIGHLSKTTFEFIEDFYDEIDSGFDFYAPQTTIDDKNRRIMIAWMGMWERNYVTHELNHGWAGQMTIPRVLEFKDHHLYQYPIDELKLYRNHKMYKIYMIENEQMIETKGYVSEFIFNIHVLDATSFGIKLFKGVGEETVLTYDSILEEFSFDRRKSGYEIKGNKEFEKDAFIRKTHVKLEKNNMYLQIFIDKSSVEIFLQHGLKTMTGLVYPKQESQNVSLFSIGGLTKFEMYKWDIIRGEV